MISLADSYSYGFHVAQDDELALMWCQKAVKAGKTEAMFQLGSIYRYGNNLVQDYTRALKWYKKAALLGEDTVSAVKYKSKLCSVSF